MMGWTTTRAATVAIASFLIVAAAAAASASSGIPQFPTEDDARAHCPQDSVVWLDSGSKIYYFKGDPSYGQTKAGAYVCQKEADTAGFQRSQASGKEAELEATPAPTPHIGSALFETFVPTQDRDQTYDCGDGRQFGVSVRSFDKTGDSKVTYTWSGLAKPIDPFSFLAAHDGNNDLELVGFFDAKGSASMLPKPVLAIPIKPYPGFKAQMPRPDGSTYLRKWTGSSTITVPYGVLDVEIYTSDSGKAGSELDAFADHVGLAEFVWLSTDGKPILACKLTKVDPK